MGYVSHNELAAMLRMFIEAELPYKLYRDTYLINVTDVDGIIQSYYASTGTAVFRDGNDRFKSHRHTEKNMSIERFISLCKGEEDILDFFN